jgi:hypothetical protein
LRWRLTVLGKIRENIQISAKDILGFYEMKKHKPWFDEGLLDERKQAVVTRSSETNWDNLNSYDVKPADISGIKRGNI